MRCPLSLKANKILENNPLKNVEDFPPTKRRSRIHLNFAGKGSEPPIIISTDYGLPAGISAKPQLHVTA